MPLSQFPAAMNAAVPAILAASESLRYIRDTTGDLTWRSINAMQSDFRTAKTACLLAIAEANKSPASAQNYLANMGGPATLVLFNDGLSNIQQASNALFQAFGVWLDGLPNAEIRSVVNVTVNGVTTPQVVDAAFVSAASAAPLRTAPQLAALIVAFEGIGA